MANEYSFATILQLVSQLKTVNDMEIEISEFLIDTKFASEESKEKFRKELVTISEDCETGEEFLTRIKESRMTRYFARTEGREKWRHR